MTRDLRCRFLRSDADSGDRSATARLDSTLLGSVGALAAHQVAYSLAPLMGESPQVSHGHLGLVWKVSLLAAVLGMTGVVLRSLRSRSYRIVSPVCTGVTIAASFASLELLERLVEGISPLSLVTELVFWLGLLATIPITFVYACVLRTVSEVVGKFFDLRSSDTWPTIIPSITWTKSTSSFGQSNSEWSRWGRGPPLLRVVNFR